MVSASFWQAWRRRALRIKWLRRLSFATLLLAAGLLLTDFVGQYEQEEADNWTEDSGLNSELHVHQHSAQEEALREHGDRLERLQVRVEGQHTHVGLAAVHRGPTVGQEASRTTNSTAEASKSLRDVVGGLRGSPAGGPSHGHLNPYREAANFFQEVVLVISLERSADLPLKSGLARKLYGAAFPKMHLVASKAYPQHGVEKAGPQPPEFTPSSTSGLPDGSFNYFFLEAAIARFPEAEGILWVSGDVALNYWGLLGADKAKVWMPPLSAVDTGGAPVWWWGDLMDLGESERLRQRYPWIELPAVQQGIIEGLRSFPDKQWERLQESTFRLLDTLGSDADHVLSAAPIGPHHLFYLPSCFFAQARNLINILSFFFPPPEVAVPAVCFALQSPDQYDQILQDFKFIAHPAIPDWETLQTRQSAGFYPFNLQDPVEFERFMHLISHSTEPISSL